MTSLNNYRKWDNIELSDDDTDTLPSTIDKQSFVKYTKGKRQQRNNEEENERDDLKAKVEKAQKELRQLGAAGRNHVKGQKLQTELEENQKKLEKLERRIDGRLDASKLCTEGYSKSVISSSAPGYQNNAPKRTDNVDVDVYQKFVEANEALLEEYLALYDQSLRKSSEFILKYPEIILCSDAETYCMFHCMELEMNGHHEEMRKCARQGQLITQALQLSKMMMTGKIDDTRVLNKKATEDMFEKLCEHEDLQKSFNESVQQFIVRIEVRSAEKKKEIDAERLAEQESAKKSAGNGGGDIDNARNKDTATACGVAGNAEKQDGKHSRQDQNKGSDTSDVSKKVEKEDETKQIGPGGLDAQEVFDSLPESLQEAFLAKNMQKLQEAFAALPPKDGEYHMKRCIAGGLWVMPGSGLESDQGRDSDDDDDVF